MTREEKVAEVERMLAKVPDVMSPLKASKTFKSITFVGE